MLGPTEVEADGAPIDLGGPLPRRLVTALVAADGRALSDDTLAEALWSGAPPASPAVSLQAYVSRLRRSLGPAREALQRAGGGYRLVVDGTDADQFAAAAERGRALLAEERPAEALRAFDAALARWRGEAFADLPEFAAPARARLAELRAVTVEERLAARIAAGDSPGAVGELELAVHAEPYRERRWELLGLALYRTGRQADALATLRRVRALLADDLGIDPGPALQQLESRLLAQDPRLLLPTPPAPAVRPLSAFLGRTAELAALRELDGTARLVTLVGPGGAGKTRLAIEHAEAPWFVRLADVRAAASVAPAVAVVVGVRGSTPDAIATALADRPGLLLLDNCEHLTAPVADLVLHLLTRCPRLRVLATSREPLGVDGERLVPVAPLPPGDAVALLTDRVTAIRPGWRPTAAEATDLHRIATALDGIPLALELAAARARVLSLTELAELLVREKLALGEVARGALAPHQTLEAAIAWSVDLLPPADRALLLRLWPFEGGFPLTAAGADLDALSGLVARSVVVAETGVTPTRYRLLEIIRAYCRGRDPDPAGSRDAHARWVRDLVEHWTPALSGPRSAHAIRILNRELPNLRAAIEHQLTAAPADALRIAGLLEWFWYRGGHVAEGLRLLGAALAGAPDAPAADRARAWAGVGTLRFIAGDLHGAHQALETVYRVLLPPADRESRILHAQALYYDSLFHGATGDFATAADRARESMAAARDYGEEWMVPTGLGCLGNALAGLGRLDEGRRVLTEAIAATTALGQGWAAALGELGLARATLPTDPHTALAAVRRAIREFRTQDDINNVLTALHTASQALALAGRPRDGATLLAAVRRHAQRRGLDLDQANPAVAAGLREVFAGVDLDAAGPALDEEAMIAILDTDQDHHLRR
ncbi:hypothetical protein GCM10010168_90820 [Actinoplanes ianthinogenes]|uniref:OmpR/PhoB-type domain-containing protein n=1 Tax=Actinoplanes ianthinogenes TaxID=122358 RepID=A0ABM7LT02_9ACTN|nr:hypothetical protein Aiant_30140 [Actinoplanes ianthinogenes]GGR57759.1 hypothetical protein GCM10010168_90820 [Actinoplanes ianthinogenes]